MMRLSIAAFVLLPAAIVFTGCGDKATESHESDNSTVTDAIMWVDTSVFYDTAAVKNDYSLIVFGAPWCGYCRMLEEVTLTDSTVIVIMNESFNCAKINIEADSMVAYFDSMMTCRQYAITHQVSGIPTTCILDRRGEILEKIVGFKDPYDYATILDAIRNRAPGPPK